MRSPHDGNEVKTYMQYYLGSVLVAEKLVRHVKYEPVLGLLIEGVLPPPPEKIEIEKEAKNEKPEKSSEVKKIIN